MIKKILFYICFILIRLMALLPLSFLYLLSDMVWPLLYYVARYRRRIVRRNLTASYPNYSIVQLKKIEYEFYRHFCDVFLEAIKLFTISSQEMHRRMSFKNTELIHHYLSQEKNVFMMLGHYGNWEWVTSFGHFIDSRYKSGQIYHPLKNAYWDRFFLDLRGRYNVESIPMKKVFRKILRYKQQHQPVIVGFIADQSPKPIALDCWIPFLNQDTPFLTGAERMAKQTDAVVIYLDITRTRRGYYEGTFRLITDAPQETAEYEITTQYARMLEETINRAPAYWLWSHKRWKHADKNPALTTQPL